MKTWHAVIETTTLRGETSTVNAIVEGNDLEQATRAAQWHVDMYNLCPLFPSRLVSVAVDPTLEELVKLMRNRKDNR